MPTKLSRTKPTRGSITPPFPSPPSTAFSASIGSTTLISPTGVRIDRAAEPAGQLLGDLRGREVEHHRPLRLVEPPQGGQGQGQLLADVAAGLVDDRQPVGVGVLGEADRRARGGDDRRERPQVLLGRLGRVVVPAVGLAPQDDRLAAQARGGACPPAGPRPRGRRRARRRTRGGGSPRRRRSRAPARDGLVRDLRCVRALPRPSQAAQRNSLASASGRARPGPPPG